ncbi:hypothetical protein H0I54_17605 [Yersinia kristensenii]|uniref:hypothetical protein n=1 Tax=Yersinia kristensenii TaxID=28152 RepID=UPI0011A4F98E|nr:hypothetical protein [Yersinia kristensenii]MBW5814042.1 hypothetical protein [Yersinia kristensenii]MBW5817788.1 hypothetical protein [Yersinia kristensenii]MBW5831230.1 hypothetical protein [Yersinia kristensenii]MBW5843623.1 hypothetical protein [Yersinia kristensenii]
MTLITASEITRCPDVVSVSHPIRISTNPGLDGEKPILSRLADFIEKYENNIIKETDIGVNKLGDTQESELDELKNARVKLAKKQFFINVIESIVSLTSFVVGVGISICSGGVATPIAVVAGLNLMLSLSNLACAYHNWSCASKNKEELTMGSDAIQQAVFMLAKYCQVSPMNAKKIARFTSYFIRAGIVVSLGVVGGFIHPVINNSLCILAKNYAPILTSMMSVVAAGALGTWMNHDSDAKEAIIAKLVITEKETAEQLTAFKSEKKILAAFKAFVKLHEENPSNMMNEI